MKHLAEQLNYFRSCYIAFNLVPKGLRKIFKQEWDLRYKPTLGEWKDTPKNCLDFYNNESRKSRFKNARCLATIQNENTVEWDCSCLFFAILFSDSIGTTLSAAISKDVNDLRRVRNDIAHITKAQLTDAEFKNYLGRVTVAFNSLSLPLNEVDEVKKQTSFSRAEVSNLKLQASNLLAELKKATSDLQVAQSEVKTKEEQVETLTSELQMAQTTIETKGEQFEALSSGLLSARDTIKSKEDQVQTLTCDLQVAQDTIGGKDEQVQALASDLQVAQDTIRSKEEQVECLTQEINSKLESFCNLTFKPPHEIIRRSHDITRIISKMQELQDRSNGKVSTIYLSGNPGCGKTQIARQIGQEVFTMRSSDSEGLTFVATLNAETLESLADSYTSLAKRLGITEYALTSLTISKMNSHGPKEIIQHLHCLILSKIKQFSEWLIIADNVVDLSLVLSYLPQTASEEWGHGQVLITTQDSNAIPANAPHTYHESLSAGMQPEDAVELLKQVSHISNHEQVQSVAEVLEYQPLALAAAAFYVHTVACMGSPNYNWTNYIKTFTCGEREATEEPLAKGNPAYSKTMTTAIKMSINSASESDEVLRQLFSFLSLCASEPLPIEAAVNFVKARTTGQTEELIKAKILKSSLITCLSEDGTADYLRVHNVVHEALKKVSWLKVDFTEKVECISVAIQVFHSLTESKRNRLNETGNVCIMLRRIITHCKVLLEIFTSNCAAEGILVGCFVKVASWLCSTASVCCDLSNPSNAKLFSTSACDFVSYINSTREGELLRADVFTVHGRALLMSCQYETSKSYHEQATKIYISIYGEEHEKVASSYNKLGRIYMEVDQYSQAKEYHDKALTIQRKIFDEDNADIAETYYNLGMVYLHLGKHEQAREYHENALTIRKKIFGEEHADVAASYSSLGIVYHNLGDYILAKEYQERALTVRKKMYGEEHADVATSYHLLGIFYESYGLDIPAKEYMGKALDLRKRIFGEENDAVAVSYGSLGAFYCDLGQLNKATAYIEKAIVIQKKVYGEEHSNLSRSYNNMGLVHKRLGQYSEAKEYYKKALVIMEKTYEGYGEQSSIGAMCHNMSIVCLKLGQYTEAKEYAEKALVNLKSNYGEGHPNVVASYRVLGTAVKYLRQPSHSISDYCVLT